MSEELFFSKAAEVALSATCKRSKCGSIIVKDNVIIGTGFNSPVASLEEQRRCTFDKSALHRKITDKTCCMHAEQRAIMDALRTNSDKLVGARLYFIRLDEESKPVVSRQPYCTICSKMALDVGITEFVLLHADGLKIYDTKEYNLLSLKFNQGI